MRDIAKIVRDSAENYIRGEGRELKAKGIDKGLLQGSFAGCRLTRSPICD